MRWSKVKQRAEANLAPELANRVRLNLTVLRATHDAEQRGTITVDGEVWLNACYFNHAIAYWQRKTEMGPSERHILEVEEELEAELDQQGLVPGWKFSSEVFDYLNTSVDDALAEGTTVKTILAVLDRRVGKRRFREIANKFKDHPAVARFVQLRLDASEGNRRSSPQQPTMNA